MAANEKDTKTGIIQKIIENDNYRKIAVVVGILGIALIFLSSFLSGDPKTETEATAAEEENATVEDYAKELEAKLSAIVDTITGQSGAQVMVTMERSSELVYATEEKKSTQSSGEERSDDTETSYIIVKKADGSQEALAVTRLEPTVKGVGVVCPRGDETLIQQSIIDALTTVLNISSARVCVLSAN